MGNTLIAARGKGAIPASAVVHESVILEESNTGSLHHDSDDEGTEEDVSSHLKAPIHRAKSFTGALKKLGISLDTAWRSLL